MTQELLNPVIGIQIVIYTGIPNKIYKNIIYKAHKRNVYLSKLFLQNFSYLNTKKNHNENRLKLV